MTKFKISIEETVVDTFEVEADTTEEAIEIAISNYENAIFVLEPGEVITKQMAIVGPEEEETEWFEF